MAKSRVTREEFHRYLRIQMSGRMNMADRSQVAVAAGLPEAVVSEIQNDYLRYEAIYGEPIK